MGVFIMHNPVRQTQRKPFPSTAKPGVEGNSKQGRGRTSPPATPMILMLICTRTVPILPFLKKGKRGFSCHSRAAGNLAFSSTT